MKIKKENLKFYQRMFSTLETTCELAIKEEIFKQDDFFDKEQFFIDKIIVSKGEDKILVFYYYKGERLVEIFKSEDIIEKNEKIINNC